MNIKNGKWLKDRCPIAYALQTSEERKKEKKEPFILFQRPKWLIRCSDLSLLGWKKACTCASATFAIVRTLPFASAAKYVKALYPSEVSQRSWPFALTH